MNGLCCLCHSPIAGIRTFWGARAAHHSCADAAFRVNQTDGRYRRKPIPERRRFSEIELTDEQRAAVAAMDASIARGQHFSLHGLAGTGKTTIGAYIAARHAGAFLCAPTAKAASVLSAKTGPPATTVHSAFYHFVEEIEREDQPPRLVFRPAHHRGSLSGEVLLDGCSLIGCQVAADILATGITVVALGDPGQLPPVDGDPFFTKASFTLTQIHRQALESPIIRQAHAVREGRGYAPDGDAVRVVNRLTADDLRAAEIILAGRRANRMRMNAEKRRVLGLRSPLPLAGEPLVCLRNARHYGLCNGAVYYASRDHEFGDDTIGVITEDGDIEVPAVFLEPGREYDKLELPPGGWMTAFAFGYALMVHMAQGSEFDNVLLIDEWFGENRIAWLYAGISRAAERITIARRSR
jgi:ATP-dependent exoDNAse (exonuclease V) alpha subunit